MKKINYCFIALVLAIFSSCEGELMPETYDQLAVDNFPKTQDDADALVTGCYNVLRQSLWSGYSYAGYNSVTITNIATTDEFYCMWASPVWFDFSDLTHDPYGEIASTHYFIYLKGVTRCINAIDIISNLDVISSEKKLEYEAELRCLIALYSYTLYDLFGPVAIVTDTEITRDPLSVFKPERPSKDWMISYIEEQGMFAKEHLPKSYSSENWGRVTKGTAMMILQRLYMHERNWQESTNITKQIMDLNQYSLQSSYKSVFSIHNEQNNEIIWAIPATSASNGNGNLWRVFCTPSAYVSPSGLSYQKWGGYKVPWNMYEKFEENQDTRLECLLRKIPVPWGSGTLDLKLANEGWTRAGAIPAKYDEDPNTEGMTHGNDEVVFRYAEVLLSRAEALNNLNGPNQESIDLLNEIRNRANASPVSLGDFPTKESFNDFLLDERFREMFFEGVRRPDLIRHDKFLEKAKERDALMPIEGRELLPIPQNAIDENPKIKQNSSY